MAFSKEIKGKTIMFTTGARFLEKLGKIYTVKGETDEGTKIEVPSPEMIIAQHKEISGEVDRDQIVYLLSYVAFAMQVQMKRNEFIDYLEELDNSDLIEFTKKVKEEFKEKKLILL